MNVLALILMIELGFSPNSDFLLYDPPARVSKEMVYFIDADAEFKVSIFFLGLGTKIYYWRDMSSLVMFWPNMEEFRIRAGICFHPLKALEITAGGRCYCYHPIMPYLYQENEKPKWEGAYSELFVRLKAELK